MPCAYPCQKDPLGNTQRGRETYVATGKVPALKHKLRDHTVELGPGVAKAFLAGAKGTEVLGCFGDDVVVEVEVDPAGLVCS